MRAGTAPLRRTRGLLRMRIGLQEGTAEQGRALWPPPIHKGVGQIDFLTASRRTRGKASSVIAKASSETTMDLATCQSWWSSSRQENAELQPGMQEGSWQQLLLRGQPVPRRPDRIPCLGAGLRAAPVPRPSWPERLTRASPFSARRVRGCCRSTCFSRSVDAHA